MKINKRRWLEVGVWKMSRTIKTILLPLPIIIVLLIFTNISITEAEEEVPTKSVSIVEGAATADCREDFSNECYNPGVLTISPGTTVTWTNDDNTSHTVTSGISFGLASDPRFKDKHQDQMAYSIVE